KPETPATTAAGGPAVVLPEIPMPGDRPRVTPVAAPSEVRFSADLPPITARGTDMTLEQVTATLSTALGPQPTLKAVTGSNNRFTFDAKDKPFWEIFQDLARQNPLECPTGTMVM